MIKRGNVGVGVLIIVAVVLGLSLVLVLSNNSSPTGYAGSPSGLVVGPATFECATSADCQPELSEYCSPGQKIGCSFGSCVCINPCKEGKECPHDGEAGEVECGGIQGDSLVPPTGTCQPTDPNGETAACDCDNDDCAAGATCFGFGNTNLLSFVNPCGPDGFCQPTHTCGQDFSCEENEDCGGEGVGICDEGSCDCSGFFRGLCLCGDKPCQLIESGPFAGDTDKCVPTTQCEPDASCSTHSDCGGVGLGRCAECNSDSDCPGDDSCVDFNCVNSNPAKRCDCECVSWAPCQSDVDCGDYGDIHKAYGSCVTGPDGTKECMCTDSLGCSPKDCVPGKTPCSDSGDVTKRCGGKNNCQTTDDTGVCGNCGNTCNFVCDSGSCADDTPALSQADCDAIALQLGSDKGCMLSEGHCFCPGIPQDLCTPCYELSTSSKVCPD